VKSELVRQMETTFGRYGIVTKNCWNPTDAHRLHRKFHSIDQPESEYVEAVAALESLPTRSGRKIQLIQPKVWHFLKAWGRVQGLTNKDSRKMVQNLNLEGKLVEFLREHSLEEDLSRKIRFKGEERTLVNWMQVMLESISHPRRHEMIASSKLLHATIPTLFSMFDNPMSRKFFGVNASVPVYCGLFLPLAQTQLRMLRSVGMRPSGTDSCAGSWPKLVDEINWTWANYG